MKKVFKTKKNIDLVYDFSESHKKASACVLLLPGIPYNPTKEYELVSFLNGDGYDVCLIHYDGTWDSSGVFLEANPVDSINDFINTLLTTESTSENIHAYKDIFVIGTSFGGGLALTLEDNSQIKAVCALSPVISYQTIPTIHTLGTYLRTEHPLKYTFELTAFAQLIRDEIVSPQTQLAIKSEKLLVFAGRNDTEIPLNDVVLFCEKHNITLHIEPSGHITFSKVDARIYQKIADFFESVRTVS